MADTDDRTLRFYRLYEQLASATAVVNQKPEIPLIESLLNEIAALFRLSKGITHFYRTPAEEQNGTGETMISYDNGKPCIPVHTVRFVTRFLSITTMTVFMEPETEPLTPEELSRVDLTMRTVLAFISRNRLQDIAVDLAFFDDQGFRNARSFFRYLLWHGRPGEFDGMAALHYNLRHFELVNEEIGRQNGDIVLCNHYRQIEKMIGGNGMLARLGGNNFVGICSQAILPEVLAYLTEARVPYDEEGHTVGITNCVGVFEIPDGYVVRNPNDIMGRIVHAYRIAQNGSQGSIVYYDVALIAAKEQAMRIQQRFPEALRNSEFQVFFQPKVHTATGEICGAEALCRWSRDGRLRAPKEFVPVLEQTKDICRLDFYMLDLVCQHLRRWIDEGRRVVRISVNLSRRHMMDMLLPETIIGIIDRHRVPHHYIEIELTETTTDVEFRDLQRVVRALQRADICTSVDDFGMGYSSLNLIRAVPWDVIKVDRCFLPTDREAGSSSRAIMFRSVVQMAKQLGLECIVEGVETPAQLEILRENGCELAQGYLFDPPLPVPDFEKRLDLRRYPID